MKVIAPLLRSYFFLLIGVTTLTALAEQPPITLPYDPADPPQGLFSEEWQSVYLNGAKSGWSVMRFTRMGDLIEAETQMLLRMGRGTAATDLTMTSTTRESLNGEVQAFTYTLKAGFQPVVYEGEIRDGRIYIQAEQFGRTQKYEYAWNPRAKMLWGLLRLSLEKGFAPGTSYKVRWYSPESRLNTPLSVEFTVEGQQTIELPSGPVEALKFLSRVDLGEMTLDQVSYIDSTGRTLKSTAGLAGLQLEIFGATRAEALADLVPADVGETALLALGVDIPEEAELVHYTLTWPEESTPPSLPLEEVAGYRLVSQEGNRLTLEALPTELPATGSWPVHTEAYLGRDPYVDPTDEVILELRDEALRITSAHPSRRAEALGRFARDHISSKHLGVAFASSGEVARQGEGDCTEHAVFLAALLRSAGLPARVAMGLAYADEFLGGEQVLVYHAWTQVYLDGQWYDLDAALPDAGRVPHRIPLAVSQPENASIADLTLGLLPSIGKITVTAEVK